MQCIQIKDYGDLSYLLEAEYERQLVALSQGRRAEEPTIGNQRPHKGQGQPLLGDGREGDGGGGGYTGHVWPHFIASIALQLPA